MYPIASVIMCFYQLRLPSHNDKNSLCLPTSQRDNQNLIIVLRRTGLLLKLRPKGFFCFFTGPTASVTREFLCVHQPEDAGKMRCDHSLCLATYSFLPSATRLLQLPPSLPPCVLLSHLQSSLSLPLSLLWSPGACHN